MHHGTPLPSPLSARRSDWPRLTAAAVLALGTIAIYARTFSVPLLFDDQTWLTQNPSVHHLGNLRAVFSPPPTSGAGGRPFLNLTYALNYAAGGESVTGYHVVNLAIHVLAAWTLFALVRRTLLLPSLSPRFGGSANSLALAVSAIWAWHPVLTVAVTYLAQRSESLMGLCYFLTLYCFLRSAQAEGTGRGRTWLALAVLACLAGVGSKEIIATVPLLAFLYDRTFLSGTFSAAWRRHKGAFLALAATWLPLAFLMAGLGRRGVGFGRGVTWAAYGLTECRAVVKYLLLAIWPRPLIFDYGAFRGPPPAEFWPYLLVLVTLLAATAVALRKAPRAGFAACWFFLILAPTSSIIPVISQPMAESRLYLPLAGVAALFVLAVFAWLGRRSLPLFAAVALGLGAAAISRNHDYRTSQALWADTVAKLPQSARARGNFGAVLLQDPGRLDEAVVQYTEAVRLETWNPYAHVNLGYTLNRGGRTQEALAQYQEAVRLKPDYGDAHEALGTLWLGIPGHRRDALAEYRLSERLDPQRPGVHNDLGNALLGVPGSAADAIAEYREALRLDPDFPEAHNNLGNALSGQPGQLRNAAAEFEEALRLEPNYPAARASLATVLRRLRGEGDEPRMQVRVVPRFHPETTATR
jgi:tetratricopeptide (TPR) repeat protein